MNNDTKGLNCIILHVGLHKCVDKIRLGKIVVVFVAEEPKKFFRWRGFLSKF
jgi:hypothetical protein